MIGYRVIVSGPIGLAYEGNNPRRAGDDFFYYARASLQGDGRAAGQCVRFETPSGGVTLFDPSSASEIPRV